jgi:hypothetical protein
MKWLFAMVGPEGIDNGTHRLGHPILRPVRYAVAEPFQSTHHDVAKTGRVLLSAAHSQKPIYPPRWKYPTAITKFKPRNFGRMTVARGFQ